LANAFNPKVLDELSAKPRGIFGKTSNIRNKGSMNVKKVLVVGAGTMGSGISQLCAQQGISVVMADLSQGLLDEAMKKIEWSLSKFIEKGKA
jgi:NADPH-dependent 2,4-dienoyl-CoA reductase/sulfur reductase-like enzyme